MRYSVSILLLFAGFFSQAQNFNLTLQSTINFPGESLANVWGYSAGGKHYALVGARNGTYIFDITVPTTPVPIDTIPGPSNLWKEIKTFGNYAYVVSEGGWGIQVINLATLPAGNLPYQSIYPNIAGIGTINSAHALHVDETKGYLYIYGSKITGGTLIGYPLVFNLNGSTAGVSNAWAPQYAGKFIASGFSTYVHDGYVDNDMMYSGHIYAGKVAIVNMANKAAPVMLGSQTTPNAFTHNTWKEGTTIFTTDETASSYLTAYNVADPADIKELDRIQFTPGSGSAVHNTYIKNSYAVTSWYKDGVAIIDVNRPANMVVTGRYDTYTVGSGSGFEGCWGVYPYFVGSDIIIASNMGTNVTPNNGQLVVLQPTYTRGCYLEGVVTNSVTGDIVSGALVELLSSGVANESSAAQTGAYKMARYGGGTYTLRVSKAGFVTYTTTVTISTGVLTTQNVPLQPTNLPVSLTAFEAKANADRTATLDWNTANERNNEGFGIEMSANGTDWQNIGFVTGQGDSDKPVDYSFQTEVLSGGNWLFRLAQRDTDGKVNYSNIQSVDIAEKTFSVRIAPNPVTETANLMVNWGESAEQSLSVEVFNGNMQLVQSIPAIERNGEAQSVPLSVTGLPTGKYLVRIQHGQKMQSMPMLIVPK
jgi:choice-of-anchor B domain-containing protein